MTSTSRLKATGEQINVIIITPVEGNVVRFLLNGVFKPLAVQMKVFRHDPHLVSKQENSAAITTHAVSGSYGEFGR